MKISALPKNFLLSSKGVLAIGTISCLLSLPTYAANFGHARLESIVNNNLDVRIPINNLTAADIAVLSAKAAPADQWQANGLNPPVAIDSLKFNILPASKPSSSILQVLSEQPYNDTIIDLLLNINTASGSEPYQVSLIVPLAKHANQLQQSSSSRDTIVGKPAAAKSITVRSGDSMLAIAKRNAVEGASIYQLMMALQRTNPQAFISNNVNLVKAGSVLTMPSIDEITSISDKEARRQFIAHTRALSAADKTPDLTGTLEQDSDSGSVTVVEANNEQPVVSETSDRLKLGAASGSDTQVAQMHALQDAKVNVSQLEDNVKNLSQALRAQGKAASDIVTEGARSLSESLEQISNSVVGDDDVASDAPNDNQADDSISRHSSDNVGSVNTDGSGVTEGSGASSRSVGETSQKTKPGLDIGVEDKSVTTGVSNLNEGDGQPLESDGANANIGAGDNADKASSDNQAVTAGSSSTEQDNGTAGAALTSKTTEAGWLTWVKDNLTGVVTSLIALLVLLIVWLLRRSNLNRDKNTDPGITETMLQEKLNQIDLNLDTDTKTTDKSAT